MALSLISRAKNPSNIRRYVLIVMALLATTGRTIAEPSWWTNVVLHGEGVTTNDFAPVNMGQLKWMAVHARDELNAYLPGGSGTNLNALLNGWLDDNVNYAPVNIGQLKNLAAHFYDRLIAEGYTNQYPWVDATNTSDYAMANIGQVKYLFDFELDRDGDGMGDIWEQTIVDFDTNDVYATIEDIHPEDDFDGDGYSNLQEYQNHTDPTHTTVFDQGLYDALYTNQLSGLDALIQAYEQFLPDLLGLSVLPDGSTTTVKQFCGERVFDMAGFDEDFLNGLVPVVVSNVVTYPIYIYDDPVTGERVVMNANNEAIAVLPGTNSMMGMMAGSSRSLLGESESFNPSNAVVMIGFNLLLPEVLAQWVWTRANFPPYQAIVRMRLTGAQVELTLNFVTNNTVEIFRCVDPQGLTAPVWSSAAIIPKPSNTNQIIWTNTLPSATNELCFYAMGDAYQDRDNDGSADVWESLIYHSDPDNPDSDNDGVLDGDEDFDQDGFSNEEEKRAGKDWTDPASTPSAAIYVSDVSGNNDNPGTLQQPVKTVAKGIELVVGDGRVVVLPGVYKGAGNYNLDLTKSVVISGMSGQAPILDAERQGRLFLIDEGASTVSATLQWLTLRNGFVEDSGGGVKCTNTTADVTASLLHCTVENCEASTNGGGVAVYNANLNIENCLIRGNRAGEDGGGWVSKNADIEVKNCQVEQNVSGGFGGGGYVQISAGNGSTTIISNNLVFANKAVCGGGLSLTGVVSTIYNCDMRENVAFKNGGGLHVSTDPEVTTIKVTIIRGSFVRNEAYAGGGGLYAEYSDVDALRCLFARNKSHSGGGGLHFDYCKPSLLLQCTIVDNQCAVNAATNAGGVYVKHNRSSSQDYGPNLTSDLSVDYSVLHNNSGGIPMPQSNCYYQIVISQAQVSACRNLWQGGAGAYTQGFNINNFDMKETLYGDPCLTTNTYRLTAQSPCIDVKHQIVDYYWPVDFDLDGEKNWDLVGRDCGDPDYQADIGMDEFVDEDGDGLADKWELDYYKSLAVDGTLNTDTDNDGLNTLSEYVSGTNPNNADTDGDGLKDGDEVSIGADPTEKDTDGDGMDDGYEVAHGLKPLDSSDAHEDSDGDGVLNLMELLSGTGPNNSNDPKAEDKLELKIRFGEHAGQSMSESYMLKINGLIFGSSEPNMVKEMYEEFVKGHA